VLALVFYGKGTAEEKRRKIEREEQQKWLKKQ
jgi:hypothetical protein